MASRFAILAVVALTPAAAASSELRLDLAPGGSTLMGLPLAQLDDQQIRDVLMTRADKTVHVSVHRDLGYRSLLEEPRHFLLLGADAIVLGEVGDDSPSLEIALRGVDGLREPLELPELAELAHLHPGNEPPGERVARLSDGGAEPHLPSG